MKTWMCWVLALATALVTAACTDVRSPQSSAPAAEPDALAGAWRAQLRFRSGAFVDMKDLEFMYVFNAGGTMTESSNYDGAPPVPPAYGVWRKTGPGQYELKYSFYVTKAPAAFDEIAKGGGWLPAGIGVFTEKITLSDDGKSYKAAITYAAFDQLGKPAEGGGEATGSGTRMGF
jgi:hypothetical protein